MVPMREFPLLASTAGSQGPAVLTVVLTGLVLVFTILVVLWIVLLVEGKVFASIDKRKAAQKALAEQGVQAVAAPSAPAAVPAAQPEVSGGVAPQVVAAISAAVAAMEGGQYTVQSIEVARAGLLTTAGAPAQANRRGQWGTAGVVSYTEPF